MRGSILKVITKKKNKNKKKEEVHKRDSMIAPLMGREIPS